MSQAAGAFDFRGAIEKAISVFQKAANAKDAAGIAGLYAEDATLLAPGAPPIKGRKNIQGFWQAFLDAGASNPTLQIVDVGTSGDLAYEIGAFEANLPNAQGVLARKTGKYVVVWKRQADGSIRMLADIFNENA